LSGEFGVKAVFEHTETAFLQARCLGVDQGFVGPPSAGPLHIPKAERRSSAADPGSSPRAAATVSFTRVD
jgi:hypothetical protein